MAKLKGKQIEDNSLDLEKIRSGSKILPNTATLGSSKTVDEITDGNEFTTVDYVTAQIVENAVDAGSGLTGSTTGAIDLGGILNKDTSITSNNKNFDITSKLSLNNVYGGFNTSGSGFDSTVSVIAYQSDNKILLGGLFLTYNGITVNRITRLNSDGTIDTSFLSGTSGFDNIVRSIIPLTNGKILVAGSFTTYNGSDCSDRLVRLNSDGTLDTSFNTGGSGFNGSYVNSIELQSDGKIIAGGFFTAYNGVDCPDMLVRLNSDGTIDSTFNTGGAGFNSGATVVTTSIQSDGKILVCGVFTSYNGVSNSSRLVRLNSDGTLDTSFNTGGSGFNNFVRSIQLQSNGKVIVGGFFTTYNGVDCPDMLVRLNSDGTIDSTFNTGGAGFSGTSVQWVSLQSDGKILVGGVFTSYNGVDCPDNLVRINSDGTIDSTFNTGGTGFTGTVGVIKPQSNKILVGGSFTAYNGSNSANRIIKLNSNGSIDIPLTNSVILNGEGALRYASDYSSTYTDRTLVDKAYVDAAVSSGSLNQDIWLEQTGFGLSGTSGVVTYAGTFTYPSTAVTNADIFINGVKLRKTEYYFDTPGNYKPNTSSTLYFDLTYLPYSIDTEDYVEVKYIS